MRAEIQDDCKILESRIPTDPQWMSFGSVHVSNTDGEIQTDTSELFACHFSWTRRNVDPRLPTESLTRPDSTRPGLPVAIVLCFMSSIFKLPTRNDIQLLRDFEGNVENTSLQVFVAFPGVKKRSRVLLFFKIVVSRQQRLQLVSRVSKVRAFEV